MGRPSVLYRAITNEEHGQTEWELQRLSAYMLVPEVNSDEPQALLHAAVDNDAKAEDDGDD